VCSINQFYKLGDYSVFVSQFFNKMGWKSPVIFLLNWMYYKQTNIWKLIHYKLCILFRYTSNLATCSKIKT
jgi:hypothetical protein